MVTFPKYESYKDSGVEWLGEIPSHWEVRKLKHIAKVRLSNVDKHSKPRETPVRLCNYTDVYYRDFIADDIDFMVATATANQISDFRLEQGDVLITKDSESPNDIAVPAYVAQSFNDVICGYHLAHIKPIYIEGSYLFRAFQTENISSQFKISANGITRYGISKNVISDALFLIPPIEEQNRIVKFLDRKTAEIDQAIAQKQRLIELLQEQKAILINQAVTKGLDPNVPMCDRGIEWLGEIPTHWDIKRLKHFSSVQSGITLGKTYTSKRLINYPYIRVANVQYGYFNLDDIAELSLPEREAARYFIKSGDILLTEGGDIDKLGRGTVWESQIEKCLHQNHVFAIRLNKKVASEYFVALVMACDYARKYFIDTAVKTTNLASTNRTKLGNLPIVLPSVDEQLQLIEYSKKIDIEYNKVISIVSSELDRINEFRQSVIASAVTGKIKV